MSHQVQPIKSARFFTVIAVDDDQEELESLQEELRDNEYLQLLVSTNGEEGLELIRKHRPDLALLDITMPRYNGLEICRQIRLDPAISNLPVIFLSGRSLDMDRIQGLEMGADDYVTKPYNPRELVLRIYRMLNRVYGPRDGKESVTLGRLSVDFSMHKVTVDGETIDLTLTEFKLLSALIHAKGRVCPRDDLLGEIWDYSLFSVSRTVDTHIQRLRTKLNELAGMIETVRGVGYRINWNQD